MASAHDDVEIARYLKDLSSFSMARLEQEPRQLETSLNRLESEIRRLATDNFDRFLEGSECIQSTKNTLEKMSGDLETVIDQMPDLIKSCEVFEKDARRIQKSQQITRIIIQNQYSVLEILEIPQLINSCVRVGISMYEEAIGLHSLVQALKQRFPRLPILEDIGRQTDKSMQLVVKQLLRSLEGKLSLPTCLRVIGYLRRVGGFGDLKLRVQFLESRDSWLAAAIASIPSGEEKWGGEAAKGLLAYWGHKHIQKILKTITRVVGSIDETAYIGNILDQCMYCALSLSRVGFDFRGVVRLIFSRRIVEIFQKQLDEGGKAFSVCLRETKWHFSPKELQRLGVTGEGGDIAAILQYPPLASLANAIIRACNSLRQCAPLTIKRQIGTAIEQRLVVSIKELSNAALTPILYSDKEQPGSLLVGLTKCFDKHLLPYIHDLLRKLFGTPVTHQGKEVLIDEQRVLAESKRLRDQQIVRMEKAQAQEEAERKQKLLQEKKIAEAEARRKFTQACLQEVESGVREAKLDPLDKERARHAFRVLCQSAGGKNTVISKEYLRSSVLKKVPNASSAITKALQQAAEATRDTERKQENAENAPPKNQTTKPKPGDSLEETTSDAKEGSKPEEIESSGYEETESSGYKETVSPGYENPSRDQVTDSAVEDKDWKDIPVDIQLLKQVLIDCPFLQLDDQAFSRIFSNLSVSTTKLFYRDLLPSSSPAGSSLRIALKTPDQFVGDLFQKFSSAHGKTNRVKTPIDGPLPNTVEPDQEIRFDTFWDYSRILYYHFRGEVRMWDAN
ncbi:hypothetical protein AAMO2058_000259100 [Amorphochlora amoebiformis]